MMTQEQEKQQDLTGGKPFEGISRSAVKRRAERNRGTLHQAQKPGQVIEMSDRKYVVFPDGSFRRVKAA